MKKLLVLKDKKQIQIHSKYIQIKEKNSTYIIGYEQIKEVYLSDDFRLPIKDLIKLAKQVPLFFIDFNGYIVGRICLKGR